MTYEELEKLAYKINNILSENPDLGPTQRFHVILGTLTRNLGPAPKDQNKGVEL